MNTDSITETFGPVISAYTRKQALADGFQVDASVTANEAGIKFPTFINRSVYEQFVSVPAKVCGQDVSGRLWDVLWMLRHGIGKSQGGPVIHFDLYVRNDNRRAKLVRLKAMCGPLDIDDPQPAITVMLPTED